jgi:hypothetical protein
MPKLLCGENKLIERTIPGSREGDVGLVQTSAAVDELETGSKTSDAIFGGVNHQHWKLDPECLFFHLGFKLEELSAKGRRDPIVTNGIRLP